MNKFYKTRNIQLGAFLKTKGVKYQGVERIEGSDKKEFVFHRNGHEVERIVQGYYGGDLVNARKFVEEMFNLRGAIFNR